MKLTVKICCFLFFSVILLIGFIHFALIYFMPLESVKNKIISTVKQQTSADIAIGAISASLFDFSLDNVDIYLENDQFVHIKKAYIHFSPFYLIVGKIKVSRITLDTVNINIVKYKDGSFNFDRILNSAVFADSETKTGKSKDKPKDETGNTIDVCFKHIQILNSSVSYKDEQTNDFAKINGIFFDIKNLTLDSPFKVKIHIKTDAVFNDITINSLYFAMTSDVNLSSMNLNTASVDLKNLILRLKDTVITANGTIINFSNPKTEIKAVIKDFSSNIFEGIAQTPEFLIPIINIDTKINADIDNGKINIDKFDIKTLDSTINSTGYINYGQKELSFDFQAYIDLFLKKIGNAVKMLNEYDIAGNVKARLSSTDKNLINADIQLINIEAFKSDLGNFTNINSDIKINNINDIKISKFTGRLNKNPFFAQASYLIGKTHGDISAIFKADKIIGQSSGNSKKTDIAVSKQTSEQTAENKQQENQSQWTAVPVSIKMDFNVGDMDVPYFAGKNITFTMDLDNVTASLDKVKGILKLQSGNGTIKDLHKLANSNALMKGLFLSLDVVSRVINALNVLDILNSIGNAFASAQTSTTTAVTEPAPEQKHNLDGKLDFDSFETALNLADGKAVIEQCNFISGLLSFKVNGDINFKDDQLDMKVNAAPGRHEIDGIMPLTMTIAGTIEEPKGSLSLLGTVSSIVTDSLLKNVVSDSLKKGFAGLLGLKKHDETGNEIQEVNISTPSQNTSFDDKK